ncbi:MAG: hypothetical protein JWM11_5805, partial [Planctomycetaceae bacterium]|nr:hypothetical protein [Planctomycetaceae bacterium]
MSSSIKSELHRGLFFAAVLSIVWQSADAVSEDVAHPAVETKADLGSRTGESKPFREELPQIDPPGLTAPVNPKAGEPLAEGGIEIEKLQHSNQPVQSLLAKIYGEHVQHEIEILRVACQPTARQLEQLQAAGERHVLQFINSRIASRKLRFLGTIVSLAEETPEKRLSQRIRKEAKTVHGPIA